MTNQYIQNDIPTEGPFAGMTPEQQILAVTNVVEESEYNDQSVVRNAQGRIIKSQFDGADDALNVVFTLEATFSKLETFKNGGTPTYIDQEFIYIEAPGQRPESRVTVFTPVTDYYKWRFPEDYKRFKEGLADIQTGTPLSVWPAASPSFVKELNSKGIRTVEQLAGLSDSATNTIRNLQVWKAKAHQYLELAKDASAKGALQAKFDDAERAAEARDAAKQAQIDQLMAMVKAMSEKDAAPTEGKAKAK